MKIGKLWIELLYINYKYFPTETIFITKDPSLDKKNWVASI